MLGQRPRRTMAVRSAGARCSSRADAKKCKQAWREPPVVVRPRQRAGRSTAAVMGLSKTPRPFSATGRHEAALAPALRSLVRWWLAGSNRQKAAKCVNLPIAWKNAGRSGHAHSLGVHRPGMRAHTRDRHGRQMGLSGMARCRPAKRSEIVSPPRPCGPFN
jgi:hypothetical protein